MDNRKPSYKIRFGKKPSKGFAELPVERLEEKTAEREPEFTEKPETRHRTLRVNQVLDDVEMTLDTKGGRLENYTLRFQGGSKIEFWVEE